MTRAVDVQTDSSAQGRHRVVIVGCGFGGLFAARRRIQLAMTRGFQTHDGELPLTKMEGDLNNR